MRKILIVEDDPAIGQGLLDAFRWSGFEPRLAASGPVGVQMGTETSFDLVILDLTLPGLDGLSVLGELRAVRPRQAIIILTARGEEADRIRGLNLGADDYVLKPFSLKELLARVEAVLRRVPPDSNLPTTLQLGDCSIDFRNYFIHHADKRKIRISQRECELLHYLACHSDRPVSREELFQNVWGLSLAGTHTRTIDMHIARLREKLTPSQPNSTPILITVHGHGYQLVIPPQLEEPLAHPTPQARIEPST